MYDPSDFQGMSKYQVYRKIRADRIYRTLGKMSVLRVVLGVLLLIFVLLFSGAVSQSFAARGSFKTAEALMITPGWMERYRPELKAYIEAGVMYQNGDHEGAYSAFDAIDNDAAGAMREACAVMLAADSLEKGEPDAAYERMSAVDADLLPDSAREACRSVCSALLEHYAASPDPSATERAEHLKTLSTLLE